MIITLNDYMRDIATNLSNITPALHEIIIRDIDNNAELLLQARIPTDVRYSTSIKALIKSTLDADNYRIDDVITERPCLDPDTVVLHVTKRKPGYTPSELINQINNMPGFFDKNPIEIITDDKRRYVIIGICALGNQDPGTHRLCLTGELIADESKEKTDGR